MTDQEAIRMLSPRRTSTSAETIDELAREQLHHFGLQPESPVGEALLDAVKHLYAAHADVARLWRVTADVMESLDKKDRIACFSAKKFLSFQIAKILDTAQNPFRKSYQSLGFSDASQQAKGPYPIFDNVTALFSATPVIVRTATYIYACTEWVDDAFHGKEQLHEIYSRLLNPTSISLANYIVDLEAGPYANQYLAWNFNSGMAAIDTLLGHVLGHEDIVIVSRNVYGGTHQLLADYYANPRKMNVGLSWFDGYDTDAFAHHAEQVEAEFSDRIGRGGRVVVYVESPCNPHGYVLDIPGISRLAHERGWTVIHDATISTPFLSKPLQRDDRAERPDYVVHSYTKDLTGSGNTTAGVVIAENKRMFIPKGETFEGVSWENTLFWDAYFIKGAFLDSDKAFEVISGMRTLDLRMLKKTISTRLMALFLAAHPDITVHSNALDDNPNYALAQTELRLGLPAPLFTIDFEQAGLPRETFVSFFDSLSPAFHHQVSLGQCNTTVLCPAFTSHSELSGEALESAGISETTIRIAVGDEDPIDLLEHFRHAAALCIDPVRPGFSTQFMNARDLGELYQKEYLDTHTAYIESCCNT